MSRGSLWALMLGLVSLFISMLHEMSQTPHGGSISRYELFAMTLPFWVAVASFVALLRVGPWPERWRWASFSNRSARKMFWVLGPLVLVFWLDFLSRFIFDLF